MRKKLLLFVVTLLAVASFGLVQLTAKAVVDNTPDCDKYAIIYCGAKDTAEFSKKFNNDGKYKDHTKVYAAFGISKADVTGMVDGIVWRDGRVTVGNKTVATAARDAARNLGGTPIAGTSAAITSVSTFGTEGQTAMVKMVNGVFKFAVIKSCGNPVNAKPVPPPVPPKPPKPPVVPTAVCDRLTVTPIANTRNQVKLAASAKTTNGGKVIAYNYYFGDGTKSTTPAPSATHTYPDTPTAKTYTITLTVTVQLGNVKKDVTAATCKGTFTVKALPPVYSCDLLTVTRITRTEFKFDTKYTAKNATYKSTTYVVRDASGKEITRQTSSSYKSDVEGKYTVEALVTFTVNGKDVTTAVNANCKKPFEIEKLPETPTAVCDGLAVDQISETDLSRTFTGGATVAGGATITGYTLDFGDGTTEPIASTSEKITSMHTYKEAKEYTAKLAVKVKMNGKDQTITSKECEVKFTISPKVCTTPNGETFPEGDKRCTPCPVPGKESFPKDSPECKEDCTTPGHENNAECVTTPPELPQTGMSDGIVALVGAGSLIAAVGYYVASRRALIG
jgi:LPXTG-motif cell wall-anchored protein